jgi:hypothetical protein
MGILRKKSRSPLGGHLNTNFGGRRRPRRRAIFGAILLVLLPYIGSSLAASVTITGRNAGGAVEFAQGIQSTVACDTSILTALDSSYYPTGDYFKVETITVSDINTIDSQTATTSNAGCGNKKFTLTVYTTTGGVTSLAPIGNTGATQVTFTIPTSGTSVAVDTSTVNTGITATATGAGTSTGVITLSLLSVSSSYYVNAGNVSKIGIETS